MSKAPNWYRDRYGLKTWAMIVSVFGGIILGSIVVITAVNAAARHYEAKACRGYGQATERPTKFASYSWWNYECLVQTSDGRWVNKDGGSRIEVNDR